MTLEAVIVAATLLLFILIAVWWKSGNTAYIGFKLCAMALGLTIAFAVFQRCSH